MTKAAKKVEKRESEQRGLRSERRLKAAPVTGDVDRRGLALAMADALHDILEHESRKTHAA